MTGLPDHNFPAFHEAQGRWEALGWWVLNPARNFNGKLGLPRREYMRADYVHVLYAGAIALLPGWQGSEGSLAELSMAQELELEIFDAVTGLPLKAGVQLIGTVDLG